MKTIFLDLETTGLDYELCEVWEVGLILRTDTVDYDTEYLWQIRPHMTHVEPTGLRIGRYYERSRVLGHKPGSGRVWYADSDREWRVDMDDKQSSFAKTGGEIAEDLAPMLDGAHIVGAVPWFDEHFLQRFLRLNGQCATNHYHLIDVENLAAGQLQMPPPWDFDFILGEYGLAYDEADRHTALGDARMVRDLYDVIMSARINADG